MRVLRRCWPSLAIFLGVQALAAVWILNAIYETRIAETLAHTAAGPLNLALRLDRLWRYADFPRDASVLLLLMVIALLPWAHAWRPRPLWLLASLIGSLLWAAVGFGFSIDHM